MKVDYKDPNRVENTLLRSNVKVINPNTTIIYSCPVTLPGDDDTASVFVAPRGLGIEAGDVLSSPQAGGVMHKVNETTATGKTYFAHPVLFLFTLRNYVCMQPENKSTHSNMLRLLHFKHFKIREIVLGHVLNCFADNSDVGHFAVEGAFEHCLIYT